MKKLRAQNDTGYPDAWNLVSQPGVKVKVSVNAPTGVASRDPSVLLNETAYRLDGQPLSAFLKHRAEKSYDTYDGQNEAAGPDWYAIEFPSPTVFNSVDMTMDCPHRDGGWWVSLDVETRATPDSQWRRVTGLQITPAYDFEDSPTKRRPYETHALMFDEVCAQAVRVIGKPGGLAQFTNLSRLAVYSRDRSRWNPACLPPPPVPSIFRLIPPSIIWDLSENLVRLTGLSFSVPYLDYYLDEKRHERWWQSLSGNYSGSPELWHLLGTSLGWDLWRHLENNPETADYETSPRQPYVRRGFNNALARAVAPIIVEGKILAELYSSPVLVTDAYDEAWHRQYARTHGINWADYHAAVQRSHQMTLSQLEGAAALLGMITNTIAHLAHHNFRLERELDTARNLGPGARARKEIVRSAIDYMQRNLEDKITVKDVAKHVGLNAAYFSTLFTTELGRTPIDALIALRLARAKEYFTYTNMSVIEVCTALGYNPNYFSRLFQQHEGMSPGQFARKVRAK